MATTKPKKNPLGDKQEELRGIAFRVMERFVRNYIQAMKEVIAEHFAKKKGMRLTPAASTGKPKLRRPRDKNYTPDVPNKERIVCRINNWEIADADVDPYVTYILVASYKGREALRSRRYKEFKDLHKRLGKQVPATALLPEPSSKFGSRNLTEEFIERRRTTLQEYARSLCESGELMENAVLQRFLGLSEPEDPLGDEAFARAIEHTKFDMSLWVRILYDSPREALEKLVVAEVKRTLWEEVVVPGCSAASKEKARRSALKNAHSTLRSAILPVIEENLCKVQATAQELRKKTSDLLDHTLDAVIATRIDLKQKVKRGLDPAMAEITQEMTNCLGAVFGEIIPPVMQSLGPVVLRALKVKSDLFAAISAGDEEQAKQAGALFVEVKTEAIKAISDAITRSTQDCIKISSNINLAVLKPFLTPLTHLPLLVNTLNGLLDPKFWVEVLRHMIRFRDEMAGLANGATTPEGRQKVLSRLDWGEYDSAWWARWYGFDICSSGRSQWWDAYSKLQASQQGFVADVVWDMTVHLQRRLHYRVLKKFSCKFGDLLWGTLQDSQDKRTYKEKVDASFLAAYHKAEKCASKQAITLMTKYSTELLRRPLLTPIMQSIVPGLQKMMSDLQSTVPDTLIDVVDLNQIVKMAIIENVAEVCEVVVHSQKTLIAKEVAKLPGFVSVSTAPSATSIAAAVNNLLTPASAVTAVVPTPPVVVAVAPTAPSIQVQPTVDQTPLPIVSLMSTTPKETPKEVVLEPPPPQQQQPEQQTPDTTTLTYIDLSTPSTNSQVHPDHDTASLRF